MEMGVEPVQRNGNERGCGQKKGNTEMRLKKKNKSKGGGKGQTKRKVEVKNTPPQQKKRTNREAKKGKRKKQERLWKESQKNRGGNIVHYQSSKVARGGVITNEDVRQGDRGAENRKKERDKNWGWPPQEQGKKIETARGGSP